MFVYSKPYICCRNRKLNRQTFTFEKNERFCQMSRNRDFASQREFCTMKINKINKT